MKYTFIDIDGTICHKHPDRDINDLDKVHLDTRIEPTLRILETLCTHDDVFPIFITARHDSSREVTVKWLKDNTNLYFDQEGYCLGEKGNLYMNPFPEAVMPDPVIKKDLLKKFLKDYNTTKDSILSVFEDNDECIKMYREQGLFVFDVNQGS